MASAAAAAPNEQTAIAKNPRANPCSLYLLPEVSDDRFADLHRERTSLFKVYRNLVAQILEVDDREAHDTGQLVFGLVESVILRRRADDVLDAEAISAQIADAALRLVGVPARRRSAVASAALAPAASQA
jgi:hypothetical protein